MPRVTSDEQDQSVYGAGPALNQRLTLRERLMERFAGHEWVRVINPDDEDYYWQYLPQHAETLDFSSDGMHRQVHREPVEAWMLRPGESEVIIGENAYLMIDGLYKKLVAKGYLHKNGAGEKGNAGRNFNWSDGKQQEDIIDKIFLGKETPFSKQDEKVRTPAISTTRKPAGRLTTPS